MSPPLRRGRRRCARQDSPAKPPPWPPCAPTKQTEPISRNGVLRTVCPGPALPLSASLTPCAVPNWWPSTWRMFRSSGAAPAKIVLASQGIAGAGGLWLRINQRKTSQAGQGAEIGLAWWRHAKTCLVLAYEPGRRWRMEKPVHWFEGSVLGGDWRYRAASRRDSPDPGASGGDSRTGYIIT